MSNALSARAGGAEESRLVSLLVTRMKQDYRWETPGLAFFNLVLMERRDFAMERQMLKGIKGRAESAGHAR